MIFVPAVPESVKTFAVTTSAVVIAAVLPTSPAIVAVASISKLVNAPPIILPVNVDAPVIANPVLLLASVPAANVKSVIR